MAAPPLADIRIHIIGAGMAGMGSALGLAKRGLTNIHVWESAPFLTEVGAGINLVPNVAKILDRWGVLDIAMSEGVRLETASVLNCQTDEVLTHVDLGYIKKEFNYPFAVCHRWALQKALVRGALDTGSVVLHLKRQVNQYDFDNTRFKVAEAFPLPPMSSGASDTSWIDADLILAGDGIKSKARGVVLARRGLKDDVMESGQAAYRILLHRDEINEDPELIPFFEDSQSYRWIGEGRHVIAYPISSHHTLNITSSHLSHNSSSTIPDSWTNPGSKEEMLEMFQDCCPRLKKLLELAPEDEVIEWKLRARAPLEHWVEGNIALGGDACHATLPDLAQGAAQAVEDAAVLAVVLSKISKKKDIHKALLVYQAIRKPRADWAVMTAASNGRDLHLPLGPAQEARDAAFKAASASKTGGSNPDKRLDK
uniref:Salicylate hydroxylase n=1 Tax=Kwoniella dejecticola CBS 10117 TaxID=1296121 RepID=A0A1A6A126_9TREE|nr:salicylate hydroxylase [Kwoniella dejecticola CBS 10117]OBR83753.1 salicylate hydroxylase [Kwoniella dejecticola CBS 10117]